MIKLAAVHVTILKKGVNSTEENGRCMDDVYIYIYTYIYICMYICNKISIFHHCHHSI